MTMSYGIRCPMTKTSLRVPSGELMAFKVPEIYRFTGPIGANNGQFRIYGPCKKMLNVQASDGGGWDHVSVSLPSRCPTWEEMQYIKTLFWDDEDCVVQFHPPKSEYVNNHPYCLHLWKKQGCQYTTPPSIMVGSKRFNIG